MTHKMAIPCTLLLASAFLFSFRTPEKKLITDIRMGNTQTKALLDTGRIVNVDSIQTCLDNYKILMANHAFTDPGGQPFTKKITVTDKLTTGETFSGKDLRAWLDATDDEYKSEGKILSVRIQFGVYDMTYLNRYEPNAARRARSNNRIAVFLIPYDAASGVSLKKHAMAAASATPAGGSGSGGGAYDFGGLQP